MKKGDLVRSLRTSKGVGVVVRAYNDRYGLVLVVCWADNKVHGYRRGVLQLVEIKWRSVIYARVRFKKVCAYILEMLSSKGGIESLSSPQAEYRHIKRKI